MPDDKALSCGAGTERVGGVCVALDGGGADTADTTDVGNAADAGVADAGAQDAGSQDAGGGDAKGSDAVADVAADVPPKCVPNCVGRNCGDDGCEGSCGTCTDPKTPLCNTALGTCVAKCVPVCDGKNCGDDGCGGDCGKCAGDLKCHASGRCVPKGWTCNPQFYAAGDACDCGCGAYDADCDDSTAFISGCGSLQKCGKTGVCEDKVPKAWTCAATSYGALDACNCGCGAPDPDCKQDTLGVVGCKTGEVCKDDGTCSTCTPACKDKECGDDGCGGSCGTCSSGGKTACDAGKCVDPCKPAPLVCKTAECGTDGCGGSCGACPAWAACDSGQCKAVPLAEAATSCVNKCGSKADSGCLCTPGCKDKKNAAECCKDYADICSCKPNCAGKACGDDGCGGSCGECKGATPFCDSASKCVAKCEKQCDGKTCGPDGCGGTCGSCGDSDECAWTGQCVPKTWHCPQSYFADGKACDCGCGAADPDCKKAALVTLGCPASDTKCDDEGLCAVTFCGANSDCAKGWCTGVWRAGAGVYKGVCAAPNSTAKAPGQPCKSDGECASAACVGGQCRVHCQADADCATTERCVGLAVQSPTSGKVVGFVAACASVPGAGADCKAQKDCASGVCTAFVAPKTFGPRYFCAHGSDKAGGSCATGPCPTGQLCAVTGGNATCGLACPGGDGDCSTGQKCGAMVFHDHGTASPADDPKVAVCVAK